jgi:glutamyl-tRNA reductase
VTDERDWKPATVSDRPTERLVALVTHARHVPLAEREPFAVVTRDWTAEHGGFVLETCHRVEAYGVVDRAAAARIPSIPDGGRVLRDVAVVRHAVTLAVGRDSVAIGEDQVLHQLREAVAVARARRMLDPILERLFGAALGAGRRARSWRSEQPRSLADVAIAVIERRGGAVRGRTVLVVGSGQMGALAARAGLAAGATVVIAGRTSSHADSLARRLGVLSVPFDPGAAIADVAGVVVALRGVWSLSPASQLALGTLDAVVVDLSVPPALTDDLAAALGDRLVSADGLVRVEQTESVPEDTRLRGREAVRLDGLIDSAAAEFLAWLDAHETRAAAEALSEQANAVREAELAQLWRRLPQLDAEARHAVEGMSRHLAARLLRGPLQRLRDDSDGQAERAVRELFGL